MEKKASAEKAVREIRRKTRRRFSAEEKIRKLIIVRNAVMIYRLIREPFLRASTAHPRLISDWLQIGYNAKFWYERAVS